MQIKNGIMCFDDRKSIPFKRTPNQSGALSKPTVIILHDTASGLDTNGPVSWLTNPVAKASAHFVVGRQGFSNVKAPDVVQLAATNVKTWHAGKSSYKGERNVNNFSIGIEIVNPGWLTSTDGKMATFSRGAPSWNIAQYGIKQITDDAHPGRYWWMAYTMEQVEAVIATCQALVAAYPTIKAIETHWLISPGRKVDTNPLFPLERVRSAVFSNRGPITNIPTDTPELENVPNIPPAKTEKDEEFDFDARTTSDLNMRPYPDSPNRYGVINRNTEIDIERQSVSQKNGKIWFLVRAKAKDMRLEDGQKPDKQGCLTGFVSGDYLQMVG